MIIAILEYKYSYCRLLSGLIVNLHVVLIAANRLSLSLRPVACRYMAKVVAPALEVYKHEGLGCPVVSKAPEERLPLGRL
jgi:hypothetical protein